MPKLNHHQPINTFQLNCDFQQCETSHDSAAPRGASPSARLQVVTPTAKPAYRSPRRSPYLISPNTRLAIAQAVSAGRSVVQTAADYELAAITISEIWQRHENRALVVRIDALAGRIDRLQATCDAWLGAGRKAA